MAVASLVLGIIGFCIGLVPCLGVWVAVPIAVIGLVLGIIALINAGSLGQDGQPKPKGMAIAGTIVCGFALVVSVVWFLTQAAAVGAAADEAKTSSRQVGSSAAEEEAPAAMEVALGALLAEYKENEVRADARFKGNTVVVTGQVGDVKKDIMDQIYVTLGTGKQFEVPVIQCFIAKGYEGKAAALSKGDTITVVGRVEGLMMNVLMKRCTIK